MSFTVLLPAYSHGLGLTHILTHHALAVRREAERLGIRACVASIPLAQDAALWDKLRSAFTSNDVIILENETDALAGAAAELLRQGTPVVVHLHGTRQLQAIAGLKRQYPRQLRLVFTVHSFRNVSWTRAVYARFLSRLLRKYVDYTIFLSPYSVGEFATARQVAKGGRVGIVPQAVDKWHGLAAAPVGHCIPDVLLQWLQQPNVFRFIYLASFLPSKRHVWLIESLSPVLRRNPAMRLILPGKGQDNIWRAARNTAEHLGVSNQVLLPGHVSRLVVPWVLSRCQAGLFTSRSETFGNAYLESMAAGLPVIGTRKGAGEWLIVDYHTGIGIEYGDSLALQRACEYLVNNPDDAAEMGRNARNAVRTFCTWENVAASHVRVYRRIIDEVKE